MKEFIVGAAEVMEEWVDIVGEAGAEAEKGKEAE